MPPTDVVTARLNLITAAHLDERQAHRHHCRLSGSWRKFGVTGADSIKAQVVNVSPKGVGLVVSEQLVPGSLLAIKFDLPDVRFRRPLIIRVVRVSPEPAGGFNTGCTFARQLTEAELAYVLAITSAPPPAVQGKRSGVRA